MIKSIFQNFMHEIIRHNLKLGLKLLYFYYYKRPLNLKKPKTIDEKIQLLKLYHYGYYQNPIYTQCADKYAVREYVKACGCGDILNEVIAVYDRPEQIDWNSLPEKFAIKWNFGNGYNIICTDKSKLNISEIKTKLTGWEKEEPWLKTGEVQYKHTERKIIVEKFIESDRGIYPVDYKIYCFSGEPYMIFTCEERATGKPRFYYFDLDWNFRLSIPDNDIEKQKALLIPRPHHLKDMFDYSRKLSAKFPFVRVDFYDTVEKLYFGELTFTPGGGFDVDEPYDLRLELGSKLNLSKLINK